MSKSKHHNLVKLQAKRNVELWIYSFADMYMILSVFFIAIAVLYGAKAKKAQTGTPSAGRGIASVVSSLSVEFDRGRAELTEATVENLRLLLPVINSNKKGFVDVEGYADNESLAKDSPFSSNLDLSNRRAVRVSEWFIAQGVPSSKLRTYSYGNGHFFKPNGNDVKTNRRVVIKIGNTGQGS